VLIDISLNELIICGTLSKLKPYQIGQIYAWGFVKSSEDNLYILSAAKGDLVLIKLIKYLEKEGIPYSLSQSCQQHRLKLNQAINDFERIKVSGKKYKEGKFDINKFHEFKAFTHEKIPRKLKDHQLKAAFHLYLAESGLSFILSRKWSEFFSSRKWKNICDSICL